MRVLVVPCDDATGPRGAARWRGRPCAGRRRCRGARGGRAPPRAGSSGGSCRSCTPSRDKLSTVNVAVTGMRAELDDVELAAWWGPCGSTPRSSRSSTPSWKAPRPAATSYEALRSLRQAPDGKLRWPSRRLRAAQPVRHDAPDRPLGAEGMVGRSTCDKDGGATRSSSSSRGSRRSRRPARPTSPSCGPASCATSRRTSRRSRDVP